MYFPTYSDSVTKTPPCHAWQCHAPLICFVFFLKFTKVHSAFCPSKRTTTWTGRDTRLRPSQSDISHRINNKGHELRTHVPVCPYLPSEISRTYHNHFSSPLIFTPQGEVFFINLHVLTKNTKTSPKGGDKSRATSQCPSPPLLPSSSVTIPARHTALPGTSSAG